MNIPFADRLLYRYTLSLYQMGNRVASLASLQLHEINRVLLVLTTGLGDAILSTPVFHAMRNALPHADIRLLCRKSWQELFFEDTNLNGVFPYYGKYRRFFKTVNILRSFDPQLTLILHGNDPDIIPLIYLSASRYIIRIPWKQTSFSFLLSNTERHEDAETVPGMHYIENRLRILDTIGVTPTVNAPYIVLSDKVRNSTRKKLYNMMTSVFKYWIFHHHAADSYKVWPVDYARQLIEKASSILPEHAVILSGAARDRRALDLLASKLPGRRIFNIAGKLSLSETAACIADADFLIGPDTGILHMAAALDVPVIGLYAPTSASLVGPRSRKACCYIIQKSPTCSPCAWKDCKYKPSLCMTQITVDEVINGILSVIGKSCEAGAQ